MENAKSMRVLCLLLCICLSFSVFCVTAAARTYADARFDRFTVKTVNPTELNINLFDYWAMNTENDNIPENISSIKNQGINKGHNFKFTFGSGGEPYPWNSNNNMGATQNLVKPTLDNSGFPVLNKGRTITNPNCNNSSMTMTSGESLQYLFDSSEFDGKKAYSGVSGLLQIDKNGYYYYDSAKNFASYNDENNSFSVYSKPAVRFTKNSTDYSQFFPFNTASQVFLMNQNSYVQNPYVHSNPYDNSPSMPAYLNHYFGLTMTTDFVQPAGGKTDGKNMTFSFSGDDDIWIFIDDVLILDIGGIHPKTCGEIDFSTGRVQVGLKDASGNYITDGTANYQNTTIKKLFEAAGKATDFKANTFADNTYHTLKMFYLERGNSASNLSLKFNLKVITHDTLSKYNADGEPVYNAKFSLYNYDDCYDANGSPLDYSAAKPLSTVTANGAVPLLDSSGNRLSLNIGAKYVLIETAAPDGYKSLKNTPIILECVGVGADGHGLLQITDESQRKTGAVSSIKAGFDVTGATFANGAAVDMSKGMLFAVPMKKDGTVWKPLSGSINLGYKTHAATTDGALEAFNRQTELANGGEFSAKDAESSSYSTTIHQLPGNHADYCRFGKHNGNCNCSSKSYRIGFYYKADNGKVYEVSATDLSIVYNTELYVPNIKNEFTLKKIAAEWDEKSGKYHNTDTPLENADFTLYKASDTPNGVIDGLNAAAVCSGTTDTEGLVSFPTSGKTLSNGTYYLVENKSPVGYAKRSEKIIVIVNDDGVYINAGTDGDLIDVTTSPGTLVKSIRNKADDANEPLNTVTATYKTSANFGESTSWVSGHICPLTYDSTALDGSYNTAANDTAANHAVSSGFVKYDITDADGTTVTNLFKQSIILTVGNKSDATGTLQIYEFLTNVNKDILASKEIKMTLTLYNPENVSADFTLKWKKYINPKSSDISDNQLVAVTDSGGNAVNGTQKIVFSSGTAKWDFTLKGYEFIELDNIPTELKYSISQTLDDGYTGNGTNISYAACSTPLWKGRNSILSTAMTDKNGDGKTVDSEQSNWGATTLNSKFTIQADKINNAVMRNSFSRAFSFYKVDGINETALSKVVFSAYPAKDGTNYYNSSTKKWSDESLLLAEFTHGDSNSFRSPYFTRWEAKDSYNQNLLPYRCDITSTSSGLVNFSGLGAGCYRLVESANPNANYDAPLGQWNLYVPEDTSQPIVIVAVNKNADGTAVTLPPAFKIGNVYTINSDGNKTLSKSGVLTLPNYTALTLPETGGFTKYGFMITGGIMVLSGTIIFIVLRKRKKHCYNCFT